MNLSATASLAISVLLLYFLSFILKSASTYLLSISSIAIILLSSTNFNIISLLYIIIKIDLFLLRGKY